MYKATVTKSLKTLKDYQYGFKHLGITILIIIPLQYISYKFGLAVMMTLTGLFYLLFAAWGMFRSYQVKTKTGILQLTQDTLNLKWMNEEPIEVLLQDLTINYSIGSYSLLGISKTNYIHLRLKDGPLGPQEFFFVHDGEYNAKQWDRLPIQPVS